MPRQIIDTESSRPRYIRRVVVTVVLIVIAVAILLILAFAAWGSRPARHTVPNSRIESPVPSLQESKSPGVYPGNRPTTKENSCCVA